MSFFRRGLRLYMQAGKMNPGYWQAELKSPLFGSSEEPRGSTDLK